MIDQRNDRRTMLFTTLLSFVVVFIMWVDPFEWGVFEVLLYPLRLFVTYVHEMGHSLAAIGTGGRVVGFLVSPDGSGLARTSGGNSIVILPAGYLGAALFGALLFFLVNRLPRLAHALAGFLGVFLIGFSLMFARPDESGAPLALVLGVGMGLLMLLLAWRASFFFTQLVLNVLAVITALNAVLDLWYLTRYSDATRGIVQNDAVQFAQRYAPLLPASVIALIWAAIAVGMLALAIWWGVWRPLRRELDETLERIAEREDAKRGLWD